MAIVDIGGTLVLVAPQSGIIRTNHYSVAADRHGAAKGVPWSAIVAMRNRLAHGYFDIDAGIVWQTAIAEVPDILPALRALIRNMRG